MDTASLQDPVEGLYDARIRGACLIGTAAGNRVHLHGGCWLAPISDTSPQMMVAFPKEFEGAQLVLQSRIFTVSLISERQRAWHDAFFAGGNRIGPSNQHNFLLSTNRTPVLAGAVAYWECRVCDAVDLGDFLLVSGEVVGGAPLSAQDANLTVNDIIHTHDPRRDQTVQLPFAGFDFDLNQLVMAPDAGRPTPARFHELYGLREWGVFLVHLPHLRQFWVSGRVIQISHRPPRMAVALPDGEGDAAIGREPFLLSLIAVQQSLWLSRLLQAPSRSLLAEGMVSVAGRVRPAGIGWFECHPQSVRTVNGQRLVIATVQDFAPIAPEERNLTQNDCRRLGLDGTLDTVLTAE